MSYFDCFLVSNRGNEFFYIEDVNDKKVGSYLKMLKQKQKKLGNLVYELPSIVCKNEIFDEMKKVIDNEIKYCNYYFEYNKKKRKCPYFNKWTYYEAKDRPDILYNWNRQEAINKKENAWIITNGRIMAIITIQDKTTSIKVILNIRNDSSILDFIGGRTEEICYKNYRKKESAHKYTEELKNHVVFEIFPKKLTPYGKEIGNVEKMLKLLHSNIEISCEDTTQKWV